MKVDKKLNLIIPVETENGVIYFHSTPISRPVFEKYYLLIGKVFASLYAEGLQIIAGPQLAYLMLKDLAEKSGKWEDVQQGFINEIRRLTNVVLDGREITPLQNVVDKGLVDEETLREVESAIVFFIVSSAMHKKGMLTAMMEVATGLYGWETTFLNSTEYAASLPMLTETESSGMTMTISSPKY